MVLNVIIPEAVINRKASQQRYRVQTEVTLPQMWFVRTASNVFAGLVIRTPSTCTPVTSSYPRTEIEPDKSCVPLRSCVPTDASLNEISHSRLTVFPGLFICSSLHFRKRIQGFCLLCVSVWPLRGPWCQLRWSALCICGNNSQHVSIRQSNEDSQRINLQTDHNYFHLQMGINGWILKN